MAEAAVEEQTQRFYCHVCKVQFENANTNFTCPHCSAGFIEQLESAPRAQDRDEYPDYWANGEELLLSDLTSTRPQYRRGYRVNMGGHRGRPRSLPTAAGGANARQNNIPFENLVHDFIVNLGFGLNWGAGGNVQLLLGNPGDYAWGREGLDAIITQLLNQMDSTGPPPVSTEVIDSLPLVKITSDQVKSKLQCSVCWENFIEEENVRQLPCQHVYHDVCIRPWLVLHGTCPICRQNLSGDEKQTKSGEEGDVEMTSEDTERNSNNEDNQATLDFIRNHWRGGGGGGPSTSSTGYI